MSRPFFEDLRKFLIFVRLNALNKTLIPNKIKEGEKKCLSIQSPKVSANYLVLFQYSNFLKGGMWGRGVVSRDYSTHAFSQLVGFLIGTFL